MIPIKKTVWNKLYPNSNLISNSYFRRILLPVIYEHPIAIYLRDSEKFSFHQYVETNKLHQDQIWTKVSH